MEKTEEEPIVTVEMLEKHEWLLETLDRSLENAEWKRANDGSICLHSAKSRKRKQASSEHLEDSHKKFTRIL